MIYLIKQRGLRSKQIVEQLSSSNFKLDEDFITERDKIAREHNKSDNTAVHYWSDDVSEGMMENWNKKTNNLSEVTEVRSSRLSPRATGIEIFNELSSDILRDLNDNIDELKQVIREHVMNNSLNDDFKQENLLNKIETVEQSLDRVEVEINNLVEDDFIDHSGE